MGAEAAEMTKGAAVGYFFLKTSDTGTPVNG